MLDFYLFLHIMLVRHCWKVDQWRIPLYINKVLCVYLICPVIFFSVSLFICFSMSLTLQLFYLFICFLRGRIDTLLEACSWLLKVTSVKLTAVNAGRMYVHIHICYWRLSVCGAGSWKADETHTITCLFTETYFFVWRWHGSC